MGEPISATTPPLRWLRPSRFLSCKMGAVAGIVTGKTCTGRPVRHGRFLLSPKYRCGRGCARKKVPAREFLHSVQVASGKKRPPPACGGGLHVLHYRAKASRKP